MISIRTLLVPSTIIADEVEAHDGMSNRVGSCELAVVIDVLRATSVMVTALSAGADSIVTCGTIQQARDRASRLKSQSILCGERNCQRIEGFDLGNSPAEYTSQRVSGKHLILTTTNGTRAIQSMHAAPSVAIASFLNLSSVVKRIAAAESVSIVCAGTNGQVTGEDVLLAGALISRLRFFGKSMRLDDSSEIANAFWDLRIEARKNGSSVSETSLLEDCLGQTLGGRNLKHLGFEKDLQACSKIDSFTGVPMRTLNSTDTFILAN